MESLPERSATPTNGTPRPERQLPSGNTKLTRITQHTRGLVEDLTSWVELRIQLAQIELEERIEAKANQLALNAVLGVVAGLAGLFALLTLAFALGAWLGHPAWGFLIVTVLLGLLLVILRAARPRLVKIGGAPADKKGQRGSAKEASSEASA